MSYIDDLTEALGPQNAEMAMQIQLMANDHMQEIYDGPMEPRQKLIYAYAMLKISCEIMDKNCPKEVLAAFHLGRLLALSKPDKEKS